MDGCAAIGPLDPHQAMRDAQDRRFEREGIPMVLALFDEGAADRRLPASDETAVLDQGAAYAEIAGSWAATLFPQVRDTDLPTSIVVLQAMSYAHLTPTGPESTR